ncbi:MAG: T9SS type A sorting domain-containing protein [Sphingobacteriaceae bacterium]|nr:T9SS type A sorting domain-containing protein [Sphingobacteriaceae bacterium]
MCDEVPTGLRIKSLDVSNLSNITMNALFRPNSNTGFVGHNPYVIGNKYALISCYQDGLYMYDISSPATPTIAGYFDTHPQGGASASNNYGSSSYNGNWGAYPYFKSGLIIANDMQNGVFILGATAFAPAANFNNAATICSGVTTTFTDVSTNTPTSWSWNIPGASVPTSTLQNPSVTFTAGGVYNATLIATNASGTNSVVKSITVTATPTVITGGVSSICVGSSATLTTSGASTYTWNPGALTGTNIVVSPTTTITYTVVGLTGSCSNTNTKILTVNALPVVNASSSTSLMCVGQTLTLTGTGAATYTWMPGNITGNTIALSPTVSTTYSVIGTSTSNCINSSAISVSVSACTGISSLTNAENQFMILPNPNSGQFVIVGSSDAFDISVYNSIGQLIKFIPQNKARVNVDLSNSAKGIYYVVINSQGKRINRKLIID